MDRRESEGPLLRSGACGWIGCKPSNTYGTPDRRVKDVGEEAGRSPGVPVLIVPATPRKDPGKPVDWLRQAAGWPRVAMQREESPGSSEERCRVTPGEGCRVCGGTLGKAPQRTDRPLAGKGETVG